MYLQRLHQAEPRTVHVADTTREGAGELGTDTIVMCMLYATTGNAESVASTTSAIAETATSADCRLPATACSIRPTHLSGLQRGRGVATDTVPFGIAVPAPENEAVDQAIRDQSQLRTCLLCPVARQRLRKTRKDPRHLLPHQR